MLYNVRLATNPSGAPFMVDTNLQTVSQDISADVNVPARSVAAAAMTEVLSGSLAALAVGHVGMTMGKVIAVVVWGDTYETVVFDVSHICKGQHPRDLADEMFHYFALAVECQWKKTGSTVALTSREAQE